MKPTNFSYLKKEFDNGILTVKFSSASYFEIIENVPEQLTFQKKRFKRIALGITDNGNYFVQFKEYFQNPAENPKTLNNSNDLLLY